MKTLSLIITAIFVSILLNTISAQQITGTVTFSENGKPLENVKIVLKNTNIKTFTDKSGHYSIVIDSIHNILIFSNEKMKTKEINVQGRTIINVSLKAKNSKKITEFYEEADISTNEYIKISPAGMPVSRATGLTGYGMPDMIYKDFNTESYSTIHENGFKKVSMNPLSTFSVDVDAASYSNIRRFINMGQLPPTDAVRIEEMINYFSYEYKQPKKDKPFSINTELSQCPWNKNNYLLLVGLQGKKIPTDKLPASNLIFLIDVSGSMQAQNKLSLLKSSFKLLVEQLRPQDRVAIVVYAGNSGLVLPSTSGSEKQKIMSAIDKLEAGGSTAGGEGLKLAYSVAEENFAKNGNNRIILATDGDFNIGPSSNAEMERLIEKEREKGIAISVLGFGMGNYKDDKMEIIADKGNGNYNYIDNLQEAKKVLVSEFGGTLFTIAKDVKFQLEFNPATVKEYRLIGYENRLLNEEDFDNDKKDAGEIGSGHTVTALYEIVPADSKDFNNNLKYQKTELSENAKKSNDLITLKLRYKAPDGFKSKLIEQTVKNNPIALNKTSNNFRFAAAVTEFGMVLRNSEFKGTSSFKQVIELAENAKGDDKDGYRSEFIRLVKAAELLTK